MKTCQYNKEHYKDLTASTAIKEADKMPENVKTGIRIMKSVARLSGLELISRIEVKDLKTGREFR